MWHPIQLNVCTLLWIESPLGFFCYFSFLDVLAGRKDPAGLSGDLLVDGKKQPKNFRNQSGYVVQVQPLSYSTVFPVFWNKFHDHTFYNSTYMEYFSKKYIYITQI